MDINIIGVRMNDAVIYIARILHNTGRAVLIRDYTRDCGLEYCFPRFDRISASDTAIDWAGIGYIKGNADGSTDDYDTTIRLYDPSQLPDYDGPTLIITDEERAHVEALEKLEWKEYIEESGSRVSILVKDYTGIVRKQFDKLAEKAGINEKDMFAVGLDARNTKSAMLAEYKEKTQFTAITQEYLEALVSIVQKAEPDYTEKELMRIVKDTQKGKVLR